MTMPKYSNGYMLVIRWWRPPYQTIQYYDNYNDAYKEYVNSKWHAEFKDSYIAQYSVCHEHNPLVL